MPLVTGAILVEFFWLATLVGLVSLLDIGMGVFLVYKLKEESFRWSRFFEGFLKMFIYSFFIGIGFIVSEKILGGNLFEIKHLVPKAITMLFVVLEVQSIDKKSQRLGNKPTLEVIRGVIKVVKEFKGSFK